MGTIRLDAVGRLDAAKRTPQGGRRAGANLTRTGVLTYYNADGSAVRELRHPDDVFRADSLETLRAAPVTVGHRGLVRTDTWKDLAVGHIGDDVRRVDDRFVRSDVIVQDEHAVTAIDAGDLVELSCGYEVDLVRESGEYNGEKYDARQTNIRYNHVGLGPANWGRAGKEVRLILDGTGNVDLAAHYAGGMTTAAKESNVRTDDNADLKKRADALETENVDLKKKVDTLTAQCDGLRADLEKARHDGHGATQKGANSAKDGDPMSQIEAAVVARVTLIDSARAVLGASADLASKPEVEIMTAAIVAHDPTFKADGKSADYLRARFDIAVESARKGEQSHAKLLENVTAPARADGEESRTEKAIKARDEENRKRENAGAPDGALLRK